MMLNIFNPLFVRQQINTKHTNQQSCDDSSDIFESNESTIMHMEQENMRKRSFVYSESMMDKFDVP